MEKQNILKFNLLSEERPDLFFDLRNGKGSFLYNHNIQEVKVEKDEDGYLFVTTDKKAKNVAYLYDSIRVEYPRTADHIFETLLTAKYPSQVESKLWNEYKSAELGLMDESFKKPYEDFLKDRLAIRESVDANCVIYNIPTDI